MELTTRRVKTGKFCLIEAFAYSKERPVCATAVPYENFALAAIKALLCQA
jgi:hypothetical protein